MWPAAAYWQTFLGDDYKKGGLFTLIFINTYHIIIHVIIYNFFVENKL